MAAARDMLDRAMSEKDWQQTVVDAALSFGWGVYHTFDSRRSSAGFPDLVLVRRDRLIFAELKREVGTVRLDQSVWLEGLGKVVDANSTVEAHVWRPSDWPAVEAALR